MNTTLDLKHGRVTQGQMGSLCLISLMACLGISQSALGQSNYNTVTNKKADYAAHYDQFAIKVVSE